MNQFIGKSVCANTDLYKHDDPKIKLITKGRLYPVIAIAENVKFITVNDAENFGVIHISFFKFPKEKGLTNGKRNKKNA